jgi:hypothetical protein
VSFLKRLTAIGFLGVTVFAGEKCGLIYVDWELVLALAAGISTIGMLWLDHKRNSKMDELADQLTERILKLEVIWAYAAEKSELEALAMRVSLVGHDEEAFRVLSERVATIEARIDHRPITMTRRKDGKFGGTEPT